MKVLISAGQGRLHLFQTIIGLRKKNIDVKIITGWVPSDKIPDKLINILGKVVGRSHLASGLKKRRPSGVEPERIISCYKSEILIQILFQLAKLKIIRYSKAAKVGWQLYSRESRRAINDVEILHLRSGAGNSGLIEYAKAKGIIVIVDHSIAHPNELLIQMEKSYKRSGYEYNKFISTHPNDEFWELVRQDCEKADYLLVNSEYVKTTFVNEGFNENKIRVIELGVEIHTRHMKNNYGIKNDKLRIVFSGAFGSRKGAVIIIEAIERLINEGIKIELNIIGSLVNDFNMPDWFAKSPNVKFHGYIPQDIMIEMLKEMDVYIFPTYVEGSAQSVKEAMGIGLPVITTNKCGISIAHMVNGIIINDDNSFELFNAIKLLNKNENLRRELGINASKTIANTNTWNSYSEKLIDLYTEVISYV